MGNFIRMFIYSGTITSVIIAIGIFFCTDKGKRIDKVKNDLFGLIALGISMCTTIAFIILFITFLGVKYETTIKENIIETEKEIVNLNIKTNVNGEINGSFFIGTGGVGGSINDEEYYYFYTKTDDRYKLEKVLAKDVELIEYDGIPKIVHKEIKLTKLKKRTNGALSNFLKLDFNKEWEENFSSFDENKYGSSKQEETIIYIPKDSIFTNFNPNLE